MDAPFTKPDAPLAQLSTSELEELKQAWLEQAVNSGWVDDIREICQLLGRRADYGGGAVYHTYTDGPVHATASIQGSVSVELVGTDAAGAERRKRVCDYAGAAEGIFVPGKWLERLRPARERALEAADNTSHARLLDQLCGADHYLG